MGIGSVDAHGLGDDLAERTPGLDEVVIGLGGAELVARQDPLLEP